MLDRTSQQENPPSLHSMDFNQNCILQNYLTLYLSTRILPKDVIRQQKSSLTPSMIRSCKPTSTEERHRIIRLMTKSSSLLRTFQQPSINPSLHPNGWDTSKLPTSFLVAKMSHWIYQNSQTCKISPTPCTHHASSHTYLTMMRSFQTENWTNLTQLKVTDGKLNKSYNSD